jgi:DNA polymerase III alpha subunit
LEDQFVDLLFHLSGHGDVLKKTCPTSVEQLAAVLAMIRPAKRYLIGKNWTTITNEVWTKPETGDYYFKKAHAVSYAMAVIVHMNLLCEQLNALDV